jgi:hypothetical protein
MWTKQKWEVIIAVLQKAFINSMIDGVIYGYVFFASRLMRIDK